MTNLPDDVEAKVIELAREVLELARAGPADNFIELGGNSLLAVVLANTIEEELGPRPEPMQIFSLSLAELAGWVRENLP